MEDEFLFAVAAVVAVLRLSVLPRWRERPQTAMFLRMVSEVEMFRSVFIVYLNIPKAFAETITQSAARFADVYFLHKVQVIQ